MASSERFQGANIIDAGKLSPYWGEHAARYVFALPFVENKSVLDIACGTGYGLAFLKRKARLVTGVDVDINAARESKIEWDEKTSALLGDGLNLPFDDESFDVITSFETLEHIIERSKFRSELQRVLRQNGKLILSTPNATYTKPVNGKPSNPFHVFEYTPEELLSELERGFCLDQLLGQTLHPSIRIPPFHDAQKLLPMNSGTQMRLAVWKALNKMPAGARDKISNVLWHKPFYPVETDYLFSKETVATAPVLVAVCRKV